MIVSFLQDLRTSAAAQPATSPSGRLNGTSSTPSSGAARAGTSSPWTLGSGQRSNQPLRPSRATTTLPTQPDPATPAGHSPRSSAQGAESPAPASQSSPGSPSSTAPASSRSPGSTAAADPVSSLAGQLATGTTQTDQPQSSPGPPKQPPTVASVTGRSEDSAETAPITAVSNTQTSPPLNSASASQSPRRPSSAATAPTTGSQRAPVRTPTRVATAAFPPSQSAASAATGSQWPANVEPARQSADSSPAAPSDQSSHAATEPGRWAVPEVEKSPPGAGPAPRTPLPPPPPGGARSIHTSSHNQSVAALPANQPLAGPVSQPSSLSGAFPPRERPVGASPLTRQATESLKWSLRRISGRLRPGLALHLPPDRPWSATWAGGWEEGGGGHGWLAG